QHNLPPPAAAPVEPDGRIAGRVAFALPEKLSARLVDRHDRGSTPTRTDDDAVAEDERRLAEAPFDVLAAEITDTVRRPADLPGCRVERREVAACAERVHARAVHGRRAARAVAAVVRETTAVSHFPQALAARGGEREHIFAGAARTEREDPTAGDRKRRV